MFTIPLKNCPWKFLRFPESSQKKRLSPSLIKLEGPLDLLGRK